MCGTGLEEKVVTLAGEKVRIGYYDGSQDFSFIVFTEERNKIIANSSGLSLNEEETKQFFQIINSLIYDPNTASGVIGFCTSDAAINELGIEIQLKKVSTEGAVVSIFQYDQSAAQGIFFGEQYILQKETAHGWVDLPGDFSYIAIAYTLPNCGKCEKEYSWANTYGTLDVGDYRMGINFSGSVHGENKSYSAYAHFIVR